MIKTALVSGRNEDGFFLEDGEWYRLSAASTTLVDTSEVRRTVSGLGEYRLFSGVTKEELQEALVAEKRRADALFLCLAFLDEELSLSTRVLIAEQADEILSDTCTKDFVLTRILSWPLPTESMANRHSFMRVARSFDTLAEVLQEVFRLQPDLQEVASRWRDAAAEVGLAENHLLNLRSDLIDCGFFRSVLNGLAARDPHVINSIIVSQLLSAALLPEERALFLEFQKRLQSATGSQRASNKGRTRRLFIHANENPSRQPVEAPFRPALEDRTPATSQDNLDAFQAKSRVDRQIQGIKDMLLLDRLPLAEKYVRELMRFQLARDEQGYAVMSLCNLTKIALEANQFDFANELVNYAIELGPTDPVPFSERAEVFKRRGQFAAALAAYEEASVRFPATTYPLNGKADVLCEMGRFEEAAALYRTIQTDFPENPVAFNGEVSVLRTQGKHRVALELALANAKRFPFDSVTRGTLAGSLSRMGRYSEASRHYQQALRLDKSNEKFIVGAALTMHSAGRSVDALQYLDSFLTMGRTEFALQQSKAQILRNLGWFAEAKRIYEAMIQAFPRYVPAILGLQAISVLEDPASAAVQEVAVHQLESELEWVGFRTYAVALIASGHPEKAAQKVKSALGLCPWIFQRTRLQTVLGIAELKSNQPTSIQTLQTNLDKLEDRQKQMRLLLLSHAQIQQGHQTVARVLLSRLVSTKEPNIQVIKRQLIEINDNVGFNHKAADIFPGELELAMAA